MFRGIIKSFLNHKENFFLLLIIIFAAFLRLYRISDYMTFLGDEGRDVLVVYNILHGNLTLLGPTASVGGFFLGPIYYYFMAPFLWFFNYNPVGPAIMVGIFGFLTVFLVYKIGSEFFDIRTGFIAVILYSISPIVIAYSRSSWNPNLVPFFSLLLIYILYKAVNKSSWKLFLVSGILLGILMQLHYLATFIGVIVSVYIIFVELFSSERHIKKILKIVKKFLYVFLGFIIGFSPFLAFETRHGFPNLRSITNFIFNSGQTGSNIHLIDIMWDVFFRLFGRLITQFPPPEQISIEVSLITIDLYFVVFKVHVAYFYFATVVLALGATGLLLFKFFKSFKEKNESFQKFSLLFFWGFIGILLFGFYKKPIYDYYLGFMFPLPFLLLGSFLSDLYKNKFGKIVGASLFLIIVVINLSGIPFRYEPNSQKHQVEKISRFVYDKTEGKPFNFALITGGNSDHAYRYFLKLWQHEPIIIQNSEIDPQRDSVKDQLLIVCEQNPCAPLGNPLWEVAGFGRAEIAGEWDVSVVKVYKLVHYKGK